MRILPGRARNSHDQRQIADQAVRGPEHDRPNDAGAAGFVGTGRGFEERTDPGLEPGGPFGGLRHAFLWWCGVVAWGREPAARRKCPRDSILADLRWSCPGSDVSRRWWRGRPP